MFSDPTFPLLGRIPGQYVFDIPAKRTVQSSLFVDTFNKLPAQIKQNTQSGRQFKINTEDRHDNMTNNGISFEDTVGRSLKKKVKLHSHCLHGAL